VINEETLSAVLSEFARTMATDFPIQKILDHLVERIVEILPITSTGSPCIAACTTGEPVEVPGLTTDNRFPRFAAAGLDAGLGAVFTFPLRHGDGRLDALGSLPPSAPI